jgi:hypothetical protein
MFISFKTLSTVSGSESEEEDLTPHTADTSMATSSLVPAARTG